MDTESLTVTLGSLIPANVTIVRAELDIEGKKNADLDVVLDAATASQRILPDRPHPRRLGQRATEAWGTTTASS